MRGAPLRLLVFTPENVSSHPLPESGELVIGRIESADVRIDFPAISRIIKAAPSQYVRAFLHSETSGGDLTYFLLHQLEVVHRATDELFARVERGEQQIRETEQVLKDAHRFNHRQRAVLSHALRHPADEHTIQAHQRAHGVVYQTARQDLLDLARSGYLKKMKRGHAFVFGAAPKLSAALKRARA